MGVNKLFAISTIFLVISLPFATSQEVENEEDFSYLNGTETGPENWGNIRPDWAACGNGQMQSPIDLLDMNVQILPQLGELNASYKPSNAVLKNRGHDIKLEWQGDAGGIQINGTDYSLKQVHWHSPSEHTINGRRYALEAHLVHVSADNNIAVVGILYRIGLPNSFLVELGKYIKRISDVPEGEVVVGVVNPRRIKWESRNYYRYMGSLTVPPCTEGVVWSVLDKVGTVSKRQVDLLREAVDDDAEMNARPIQPTNGRPVGFYRPKKFRY
ncbi:alpha carbonic anhydrase 7-like [Typha angustifolia]|uniref:alpha carbonic anhydrase 7-like n=1 Tax=Typha angustifolia TaxID=59011 RepID=UPI003C2AFA2B